MDSVRKQAFYWRAVVTFYVVFSFIVIAASGLVLYVAPPGRVANWSQWRLAALLKADWQAVHTVFSLLFVVAAAIHLYFNWRVIANYLRRRIGEGVNRGREVALATAVGSVILVMTLAGVPPFSTIVTVGETAKASWSDPSSEPPVPHAELWTIAQFAEANKMTADAAMENLRQSRLAAPSSDTTLQAVAATYKTTPRQVYTKALGAAKGGSVPMTEGGGYGRKTLGQVCGELNIPVETALDRLQRAGFVGASAESNMRQLATGNNRRPAEIAQIVRGLEPTGEGAHR